MTDERPAASDTRADNAATTEPPRPPRWRRFVKPFLISLAFAAVVDVTTRLLASHVNEADTAKKTLQSFNRSVEYGLESVQVLAMLRRVPERLADRYHTAVRTRKAPFNLSEACRNGEARNGVYGIEVSNLCYTPPPPPLYRNPLEYPIASALPAPPVSPVDEKKYPRNGLKEIPLGIPDALRHTLACAWHGKDNCRGYEGERSNWFGKLLLVAAAVFSLAVTLFSEKPPGDETPPVFSFVVIFFISLFYAGAACAVLLLAVQVLAALGLWLSGVWAALAGFPIAVLVFSALKDLAADEIKGYVAKKV